MRFVVARPLVMPACDIDRLERYSNRQNHIAEFLALVALERDI
jgi:hypothetical protein